jgi:hypothetical protein
MGTEVAGLIARESVRCGHHIRGIQAGGQLESHPRDRDACYERPNARDGESVPSNACVRDHDHDPAESAEAGKTRAEQAEADK